MTSSPPPQPQDPTTIDTTTPSPQPKPIKNTLARNALLTTLSPDEYKLLHHYVIAKAPGLLRQKAVEPGRYEALVRPARGDGGNIAALRVSLRLFLGVNAALKVLEGVTAVLARRGGKRFVFAPLILCRKTVFGLDTN